MNRPALALALLALVLTVACSSANNKVIEIIDGQQVVHTMSDEAMYYYTQEKRGSHRKPVLEMEAKEGEEIELKGVKKLVVWGYDPLQGRIPAYQHPWAKAVREWGGIAGNVATIGIGGYFMSDIMKTVVGQAGVHISDAFKSSGDYASPSYFGGDGSFTARYATATPTIVPQPDPIIVNPVIVPGD